jgi:hypothetical protein
VVAGQAWPDPRATVAGLEVGTRRQGFGAKQQDACWKLAHMTPGMPEQPVSDPQFWRDLAAKARARADYATEEVTKQLLLRIAETHERTADRVEQLLPNNEK